jgi:uncharacterized SAM-binding protein YcdF (DUF218 family)
VIDFFVRRLEAPLVVEDALEPADAIVVLGAALARDGRLSPILEERVAAAAALYHAGAGRLVVATGGITQRAPRAEADAIAEALSAAGIPDVVVEREARSTAENARLTARLLRPLGARTVWLVTQPFHGRRAALLFRRAGLAPRVWHIADSVQYRDRRRAMKWVAREYASWALLAVRTLASRRS